MYKYVRVYNYYANISHILTFNFSDISIVDPKLSN